MFARISTLFLFMFFTLPLLVAASVLPRADPPANQCSAGDLLCCNSVEGSNNLSGPVALLLGLLGIVVSDLAGSVGVTCSPLSAGGNPCTKKAVCCTINTFGGIVALGCSPANTNP